MNQRCLALAVFCILVLPVSGCSSGQQLVAINVNPATVVFGSEDPSLNAQLTALGVYTHPPATKDITTQVTWQASVAEVVAVSSSGVVSPTGTHCGVSSVTATLKTSNPTGNIVQGSMSVTVDGPAVDNCPNAPL